MRDGVTELAAAMMISLSLCFGCGGGAGGGRVTGVAGDETLMTLTPSDEMKLCTDVASYETRNVSKAGRCRFQGVTAAFATLVLSMSPTDADLQSACAQAAGDCNAAPAPTTSSCRLGHTATCAATATVDDLSRCTEDDVTATNAALAALPDCSSVTMTWLDANGSTFGAVAEPPSCAALSSACPETLMPRLL